MEIASSPYFSLIVTTKDRPKDLSNLFESISKQMNPPSYEVIVVDDGSVSDYSHLKDQATWIDNVSSLGPSFNRNIAAKKATGKFLLFLDDDTILLPTNLCELKNILEANPKIGALGGCGPAKDESLSDVEYISVKTLRWGLNKKIKVTSASTQDLNYGDHIESAYMAISRDLFFDCGGFDPYWFYMGEDRDLCLSIKKKGYLVAISWKARAIHINHTSYGTSEIAQRRAIRFKRIIEVSLKQKGLLRTVFQIAREFSLLRSVLGTNEIVEKLRTYPILIKRRGIDFTSKTEIIKYKNTFFSDQIVSSHPKNIVLFINNRCNAKCEHCFIPDLNTQTPELNYNNWLGVLKGIQSPFSLSLTGGEPLLNKDLKGFIESIFETTSCKYIGLLTNGSFPEQTAEIATYISNKFPDRKFKVQISLDGTKDIHNQIRKNKNSFDQAIKTGKLLQKITSSRFEFVYLATLTKNNKEDLSRLFSQLAQEGFQTKFTLVRGNSFSTFDVPTNFLHEKNDPQEENLSLPPHEIRNFVADIENKIPNFFYKKQKAKILRQIDTLEQKKRLFPCYAGKDEIVFYSDGNFALCEQTRSIGNVADYEFNFEKLWNATAFREARSATKNCSCIHGCNISTGLRA